jgi:hypothetical protein
LFERAAFFGRSFLLVISELEKTFKKRLKKHYKNVVELKNSCIFVFKKHKKQIDMNNQVIKSNGFTTKRIESNAYKGVFGGKCNHVVGLFNADGKILCLSGKPYFPAGRKSAFASLILSGDINAPAFSFEKY